MWGVGVGFVLSLFVAMQEMGRKGGGGRGFFCLSACLW